MISSGVQAAYKHAFKKGDSFADRSVSFELFVEEVKPGTYKLYEIMKENK